MSQKDEEILGVWSELFEGYALAVRAVQAGMAGKAPLTMDEYDVLLSIKKSPEQRIRFAALAEATVYTKSGITRVLKRLEHAGFAEREECPDDKRGFFAVLTASGDRALRNTWQWYSAAILQTLSPLFNLQEAQTLRKLLGRITDNLNPPELVKIRPQKSRAAS